MAMSPMTLSCIWVLILAFLNSGLVDAAKVFRVGDDLGWREPEANGTALYSQWASRNRFRVGDSLSFEYKNDSVIEVDKWGFYHCNATKPIIAFNNGKSVFKLERPGPFYFISGIPNHCKNGQRLLVEVMGLHRRRHHSPSSVASPPEPYYLSPLSQPSSAALISVTFSCVLAVVVATFGASLRSAA